MNDVFFSIIVFAVALIVGLILYNIAVFVLKRVAFKEIKILHKHLKSSLRFLIPAICVIIALPLLRFPQDIQTLVSHIANIWMIGALGWFSIKIVHLIRELILIRYDIGAKDNLNARRIYTQVRVITHVITAIIVVLTISLMMMTYPKLRQIGVSLLASAGIAGIILGFAAQKTLSNLVAGIQIALAQPIRLDDVVIVEGEWGWIEEITLTYVVVRIWDLRRLVVPISYFIEKPFQNWTRMSADILGTVFIYTDYTIPVKEVRKELTRILEQSIFWDKKVNVLQVTNASEKTVELRALMSAVDSPTAWNLRCEVREKLLEFMQKRYPESLPRMRVEVKEEKASTKKG